MRSGQLRKRVIIQRDTGATVNDSNEPIPDWTTLATRWAKVMPVSGKELIVAQQQKGQTMHKVTLRYGADIADLSSADRITIGSRVLHISSVINEGERNKEFTVLCTEDVS